MSEGAIRARRQARPATSPIRAGPWLIAIVMAGAVALLGVVVAAGGGGGGGGRGAGTAGAGAQHSASPFAAAPSDCRVAERLTPNRRPQDWARSLLDQEYALAADDAPTDLVRLADRGIDGNGSLRALVIDDLAAMARAAAAADAPFRVTSAYRSYAQQVRTFASLEASLGHDEAVRSAARPGHSEHQLGTTIDVKGGEAWLASHAGAFGFVLSYPPGQDEARICYKAEPWHFRYLGRAAARTMTDSGLSLREWLWSQQLSD